jgi:hypothetical protein
LASKSKRNAAAESSLQERYHGCDVHIAIACRLARRKVSTDDETLLGARARSVTKAAKSEQRSDRARRDRSKIARTRTSTSTTGSTSTVLHEYVPVQLQYSTVQYCTVPVLYSTVQYYFLMRR